MRYGRRPGTDITPQIIGAAIKIHRRLGPGLLESAYEACLINFHVVLLKDGIRRMVNNYEEPPGGELPAA